MKALLTNPGLTALVSFLLALPFIALLLQLVLGMEPSLGPLDPLVAAEGSYLGSVIVIAGFLLLLAAFAMNLALLVRLSRAGIGLMASPVNLVLATIMLLFVLMFVGAIVVDQYPCWTGVPNCD